jgi:hypothetical protein
MGVLSNNIKKSTLGEQKLRVLKNKELFVLARKFYS